MDQGLRRDLLDFDRTRVKPDECVISWKALSRELGVSEDTLQRWCAQHRIELPRWGPFALKSPVFLPRVKVQVLKSMYFG